jgi:FMN phosphatase YigB (HAD superfamily)
MIKRIDPQTIKCIVFDFGGTLSSDHYFTIDPKGYPQWQTVIQQNIFNQQSIMKAWMKGDLCLTDIATIVSQTINLPIPIIVETMERGCTCIKMNESIWQFACSQKKQSRKTALVTANMDVFTKIVVPLHGLNNVFDVILNTSDYHELNKQVLWEKAFELVGNGISYKDCLLIEDGEKQPVLFRQLGGTALQYENDHQFEQWLQQNGWHS